MCKKFKVTVNNTKVKDVSMSQANILGGVYIEKISFSFFIATTTDSHPGLFYNFSPVTKSHPTGRNATDYHSI